MGNEKIIDGVKYIPTKYAAEITAYAADYIGQLCRSGKIDCKRFGRAWFVSEQAILNYTKPLEPEAKVKKPRVAKPRVVKEVTLEKNKEEKSGLSDISASARNTEEEKELELEQKVKEEADIMVPLAVHELEQTLPEHVSVHQMKAQGEPQIQAQPEIRPEHSLEKKPELTPSKIEDKPRQVSPFVTMLAELKEEAKLEKEHVATEAKNHKHTILNKHEEKKELEPAHIRVTEIPTSHIQSSESEDEVAKLRKIHIHAEAPPHAIEFPEPSTFDKAKVYGTHAVALAVVIVVFVFSSVSLVSKSSGLKDPSGLFTYDNVMNATANASDSVANLQTSVSTVFQSIGEKEYDIISSFITPSTVPEQNAAAVVIPERENDIARSANQIIQTYK